MTSQYGAYALRVGRARLHARNAHANPHATGYPHAYRLISNTRIAFPQEQ
jgi:hypothetical protein